MCYVPQRNFLDRLGLESTSTDVAAVDATKGAEVSLWKDQVKA